VKIDPALQMRHPREFLGKEAAIRGHLPTYEVAFQVMEGTQVRVNDFYRTPLLKAFERVMVQFSARVTEEEIQVGLFRVPVPNYDLRAFREAFVNALVERGIDLATAVEFGVGSYLPAETLSSLTNLSLTGIANECVT
jgi:hypothetical protein